MQICNSLVPPSLQNVPRETFDKISVYVSLLEKWQKSINLVSKDTADIWGRHIEDSAQLIKYISEVEGREIVDMGSGGGLPGIVLACLLPGNQFYLIESDKKKCIFLNETARVCELKNVSIICERIENWSGQGDIIVSRALAPLELLMEYSVPKMQKDAYCLFPKGQNWDKEIAKAQDSWDFQYTAHQSTTREDAAIIEIHQLRRITH